MASRSSDGSGHAVVVDGQGYRSGRRARGVGSRQAAARKSSLDRLLGARECQAVRFFVWRVLNEVPAQLIEAAVFGSTARGEARPYSDVDILLIFRDLPPDREPQASKAEGIADEVAARSGVPITVWSVALGDLERGNRTPMLVDALHDAVSVWCWPTELEPVSFTPEDACSCAGSLLDRVREGSREFAALSRLENWEGAARRSRDDMVRLCTAILLLHGVTRPRRAEAIEEVATFLFSRSPPPVFVEFALVWAARSFGPEGREEDIPVTPPEHGFEGILRTLDFLRAWVVEAMERSAGSNWRPTDSISV